MRPIPVEFHIWRIAIHTYGIGLAITFWVSYRYFARRLAHHGYDTAWLGRAFAWIIAMSIVGARIVSVVANWGFYSRNPGQIPIVWHGGLSSYGGLALGVPTGLYLAHRWAKGLKLSVAADIVAPVLAFAWAIGRLLGPQLMVSGGGNVTHAWYGMSYAGQTGKRVPVPIFQSLECFVVWGIALLVERWVAKRGGPIGLVTTATVTFYGAARYFDEHVLLAHGPGGVAVEAASLAFVAVGLGVMAILVVHGKTIVPAPAGVAAPAAGDIEDAPEGLEPADDEPARRLDPWAAPVATETVEVADMDDGTDAGDGTGAGTNLEGDDSVSLTDASEATGGQAGTGIVMAEDGASEVMIRAGRDSTA